MTLRQSVPVRKKEVDPGMSDSKTAPVSIFKANSKAILRHFRTVVRYGSIHKFRNLLSAYIAFIRGKTQVTSMPAFLKVEISRKCHINCLYCSPPKDNTFYPLDLYKSIIDQLKNSIFLVSLYDIGEPLLNYQVSEYIRYAEERRIGTVISSTLSLKRDDSFWGSLVASGLNHLIVAIDGITPAVYNRYRCNGQLDLALSNLRKILAIKKETSANLYVEWQMIDFPWNRHEQAEAKRMAYELGCNCFRIIPDCSVPHYGRQSDDVRVPQTRNRSCLLPYILLFISAHGNVQLCYKVYHHDMCIGRLTDNWVHEVWNGSEIARVRDPMQIRFREGCKSCTE